ncbi:MAG: galactokinase family protein [Desulfocapsaceae bacterium]
MEFPDIQQQKKTLVDAFSYEQEIPTEKVSVISSPYRICPLGAHIDHQGGPVLGMTINACTLMAFYPESDTRVRLRSKNYPGKVNFSLDDIPESPGSFWGLYPRAAALALKEKYQLKRGICGLLDGMLPGCGLSSSASVLLAYLHAFARANELELSSWDYVNLTRRAENKYIGLNNGILDQTSIVFGEKGHLLHIDTVDKTVAKLPDQRAENDYRIIVAYSGYSRELTTSGYNSRVDECRLAAAELSRLSGRPGAEVLSGVERSSYDRFESELQPSIRKRANHFFSESQRVMDGLTAWNRGDIETFGKLMNLSCKSSIEQYECGVPAVCDLQQIVSGSEGVYGSRFMGGGFGGCVVGLARSSHATVVAEEIETAYKQLHPEVAEQAFVRLGRSDHGVRFL